jgi:hypothetical protein
MTRLVKRLPDWITKQLRERLKTETRSVLGGPLVLDRRPEGAPAVPALWPNAPDDGRVAPLRDLHAPCSHAGA